MGHEYILLYLLISVVLFGIVVTRKQFAYNLGIFTLAFIYKLILGTVMTYLLINRYGMGDFNTYYFGSIHLSHKIVNLSLSTEELRSLMSGVMIPTVMFALVFIVLPPSIYGLTLLSSTVIFISFMYLYRLFIREIKYKKLYLFFLFFTPSIVLQSSYVGKETVVIPAIVAILSSVKKNRFMKLSALFLVMIVFLIRSYQGIFLVLPYAINAFKFLTRFKKLLAIMGSGVFLWYSYTILSVHISGLGLSIFQFQEFLNVTYEGGSLILEPFPFPFLFMQNFRPFPWEANNAFALVASLELSLLFGLLILFILCRFRVYKDLFLHDPFFAYVVWLVLIQMVVFSFSSNMGDLTRRRVYYFPFLFTLLFYHSRYFINRFRLLPQAQRHWNAGDGRKHMVLDRG